MDHAKYLFALAEQLNARAEACEDDAIYDELIIVANICRQAAEAIDLHTKEFAP